MKKKPTCPICGELMEPVEALVMKGTDKIEESESINDDVTGWVCPSEKCKRMLQIQAEENGDKT